jgi:hypothetical protein
VPPVGLFCDESNKNNTADPTDLPLDSETNVYWQYQDGTGPTDGSPAFTVTLDPGVCSNNPDATKNTIITTSRQFCTIAKSTKYAFTVYGCNPSPIGSGTITFP